MCEKNAKSVFFCIKMQKIRTFARKNYIIYNILINLFYESESHHSTNLESEIAEALAECEHDKILCLPTKPQLSSAGLL